MNLKNKAKVRPRICFVHIPKTAGTSITSCLQNFYPNKEIVPARTMLDYNKLNKEDLKKYRLYKGHIYYSFAKANLPPDTIYITVLRDPLERVISLYKFWRSHTNDFFENPNIPDIIKHGPKMAKSLNFLSFVKSDDAFVMQSTRNNQIKQLSKLNQDFGKNKQSISPQDIITDLSNFGVVGILDFVSFFAYEVNQLIGENIFKMIPKENVSAKNKNHFQEITNQEFEEAIELIKDNNRMEIEVYNSIENSVKNRINSYFNQAIQ